ncbi:ABC transporter permease [Arthrobacter sp. zg-Y859]|uniref:ABC transporter permease n=1 Tax=Arthrobacter jinronghuae TaxID=2964609 RepID=A0ABT1NPA0_9MICC|nr:ABC transporter permease [Arthrobacter jinronghuae]MCQ1952208.1 ABC transporter permease [Arthrobacter sp. zg-Y238]UWX80371.1 ABC transporter permease [Arthrobacter jinronghuae]
MSTLKRAGYFLGLPLILLAAWIGYTSVQTNFFIPEPAVLADRFFHIWFSERLMSDVLPSIGRLLAGLGLSIVAGVTIGVIIGYVRWIRWLFEPLFEFIRAVPSTILIPVLLLLIGINDAMKITLIVCSCIWPILLNTVAGVTSIDEVLQNTAKVIGLKKLDRMRYLVLPAASPQIMAGIRQSLAVALILMVVSEMFASTDGIGHWTINFQNRVAIPEMWSGILLLGIIGVVLSVVFHWIQKRILAWYEGLKENEND